jgi:tRNA pseudouridine38-40 synthase
VQRYRLTIAYDGTDFCGWQKQEPPIAQAEATGSGGHIDPTLTTTEPGRVALRTVQAIVERAVREVVREPVLLHGASRTDSGVHARGQVAAFTATDDPAMMAKGSGWPLERGTESLRRAINGRLPEDVMVVGAEPVASNFDPIGHCTGKGYSYTMHASRERPLWDRRYVHQVWEPLELEPMQEVAAAMVGEHDFAAFAAAGHGRLSTVRRVDSCEVEANDDAMDGGRLIRITVTGGGFLYNQVRIMAGTIVEAGRGRIDPGHVPAIIASRDRSRAGPTMKPEGLCLEWIRYAGE